MAGDLTRIFLWTQKCIRDVAAMGFDLSDVADLLKALREPDYNDSEWCENGREAWAACDAYTLRRMEFVEAANKNLSCEYFLKIAIGKGDKALLMVSCHPPK